MVPVSLFCITKNRTKHSLLLSAKHVVVSSGKAMQLARKICQDILKHPPYSSA